MHARRIAASLVFGAAALCAARSSADDSAAKPDEHGFLPVKAGAPFLLNARLYWPKAAALEGRWGMPAVERLD